MRVLRIYNIRLPTIMTLFKEPVVDVGSSNMTHLRQGGLGHLERFLGLRLDNAFSRDAVFISLDLEVASDRQRLHSSTDRPLVRQLGFAHLDIRGLYPLIASTNLGSLTSVHMYQLDVPPRSKRASRREERPCIFTRTQQIRPEQVPSILMQNLRIQDNSATSNQLRPIILIGHSVREDLKILRFLGIDIPSIAPIAAVLDTHTLSRFVLPPHHPHVPKLPGQDFSLRGVLAQLGCQPPTATFHNAANDAVYSLLAMLLLAVHHSATRKDELNASEVVNLQAIKHALSRIQRNYPLLGVDIQVSNSDSRSPATLGSESSACPIPSNNY